MNKSLSDNPFSVARVATVFLLVTALSGAALAKQHENISLTMRHAELAEVMEMLSRHERVNILLAEGVEGQVSFSLFDVHLEEAIRTIANAAGYAVEKRESNYFIVEHDNAGRYVPDGITELRSYEIRYADPENLRETLAPYLSAYGKLSLAANRKLLIIEDTPEFQARIARLVADLDREPAQILIEAKILEVTLNDEDSFGLDWQKLFTSNGGGGSLGGRGLANPDSAGFFFSYATPDVEATLTALTARGRVRTLSTPKLLALQNQESSVIIGDRRGYQVTTTINQVTSESIEFLESGVILRVRPNIDARGRILLEIHPEVSNGTVDANGIPSQTTTEVTTQLIVPSGETVFIGGLMKHTLSETSSGVPVLSQLPGLGRLFARTQKSNVNTETVVLITPRIVATNQNDWGDAEREIVELHDEVAGKETHRLHKDLNRSFRETGIDLSRYESMRISRHIDGAQFPRVAVYETTPGRFTLALFTVASEAAARQTLVAHQQHGQLGFVPAPDGNSYLVVYGRYSNIEQAEHALARLPEAISGLAAGTLHVNSVAASSD